MAEHKIKNPNALLLSRVRTMTEEGYSATEIGRELGLAESTVRLWQAKLKHWTDEYLSKKEES